jgi:hypothetical protein
MVRLFFISVGQFGPFGQFGQFGPGAQFGPFGPGAQFGPASVLRRLWRLFWA